MTPQNTNVTSVAIVGATGYSGAELVSLMARHPHAQLTALYSGTNSPRAPYASLHPSLAGTSGPDAEPFSLDHVLATNAEVIFLATPNETSAELAPALLDGGRKVIDLSGAFRLHEESQYPQWYGFAHPQPALLDEAVYGLTEFCNGELKKARLIANPGCYPTSILLALRPLVPFLDHDQPVICDSKSGISGAGKKADLAYSFAEVFGNFKAYSVGGHRHEPEIRQGLKLGARTPLVFVPHLLPTVRGILSTLHVGFVDPMTKEQLDALYAKAFINAPFVKVLPGGQLPELRNVVNTPRAEIGYQLLQGGRRAVIVSVIDNLLKGAASQAVQNFNRMCGYTETEALV
jgi:N-acetyl-gamma-glutamyl-phosphate reductase